MKNNAADGIEQLFCIYCALNELPKRESSPIFERAAFFYKQRKKGSSVPDLLKMSNSSNTQEPQSP